MGESNKEMSVTGNNTSAVRVALVTAIAAPVIFLVQR